MYDSISHLVSAGFPMTSLCKGIPLSAIWKRADFGQVEDEFVRSPAQVVYSLAPSVANNKSEHVTRTTTFAIIITLIKLIIGSLQ